MAVSPFRFPFPWAFRAAFLVVVFLIAPSMVLRVARHCTALSLSSVLKALRSPLFAWLGEMCEMPWSSSASSMPSL